MRMIRPAATVGLWWWIVFATWRVSALNVVSTRKFLSARGLSWTIAHHHPLAASSVNGDGTCSSDSDDTKVPQTGWNHNVPSESSSFWETGSEQQPARPQSRRQILEKALLTSFAATLTVLPSSSVQPAHAYYDKNYPEELVSVDGALDGRTRKKNQVMAEEAERTAAVTLGPRYKPITASLWGTALWFLSGSRSNPLVTPVANILYQAENESWLRERNLGLFADLPLPLLLVLAALFVGLGWGMDAFIVTLADGDRNISLQLAGVCLIGGASLELGRIASGEKAPTRDEADRAMQLQSEFEEFASRRLTTGGNCHRRDVVSAFRRFNPKYRQADSEEYPLTDLEIERLLKAWALRYPNVERTSAGFYYGLSINKDADVFA